MMGTLIAGKNLIFEGGKTGSLKLKCRGRKGGAGRVVVPISQCQSGKGDTEEPAYIKKREGGIDRI